MTFPEWKFANRLPVVLSIGSLRSRFSCGIITETSISTEASLTTKGIISISDVELFHAKVVGEATQAIINRLGAASTAMTFFSTVGASEARPVARLGTFLEGVTFSKAILALVTLLCHMTFFIAVATSDLAIGTLASHMTGFATRTARLVGAILDEMSSLIAFLASDEIHVGRVGAFSLGMTLFTTVATTGATLLARFLTGAGEMVLRIANGTLASFTNYLFTLLLAEFGGVADF
jgi:hypothetical protein